MKKYYIVIENIQQGPFYLDELESQKINPSTLVWTEAFENWIEAKDVPELKYIFKSIPPPIPNLKQKTIIIEAEASKKKEELISTETKIVVAKETKANVNLIIISLVVSLISFPVFFGKNEGLAHLNIATSLEDNTSKYGSFEYKLNEDFKNAVHAESDKLHKESNRLGYINNGAFGIFDSRYAVEYHKREYKDAASEALPSSIMTFIIASIVLVGGRYMIKGSKWVKETSEKTIDN